MPALDTGPDHGPPPDDGQLGGKQHAEGRFEITLAFLVCTWRPCGLAGLSNHFQASTTTRADRPYRACTKLRAARSAWSRELQANHGAYCFCCILLQAVLLLAAGCMHADAADAPDSKQQPQVLAKQPKNIEEEYYNVPIRSVLGEGPKQPLSTGKIMNQLGEFEIVNEGRGDATGDLKYSTPSFSEYPAPKTRADSQWTGHGDSPPDSWRRSH